MDIERFKRQHDEILQRIDALRVLARNGVAANAQAIAQGVSDLGTVVKLHLAIEDRILYPAARQAPDQQVSEMAARYQDEMKGIASAYIRFTTKWSNPDELAQEPEAFRAAANTVLKAVYERMQRENREFYPAIEQM